VTIVGPRFKGHTSRAPISFTNDVLEALAGYRHALRVYTEAARAARTLVSNGAAATELHRAEEASQAATEALSAAKESLNATLLDSE
jgi:hypothetical protein